MGFMKDRMIKEQQRGWQFVPDDDFVCDECFDDYAIKEFVVENASQNTCTYCGRSSPEVKAVPMNDVLDLINESIEFEYERVEHAAVAYSSEDGGWQAPTVGIYDIFDSDGDRPSENEKIMDVIYKTFGDQLWVERGSYVVESADDLAYSWERFVDVVKHESRYLFTLETRSEIDPDLLTPAEMLDRIGDIVNESDLFAEVKAGTHLFRGRSHYADKELSSVVDLGTPPQDNAIHSNRMSPAGIPMFYGALDEETVVAEVGDPSKMVTVATFETARNFWVLDFTNIPDVPSLFDQGAWERRAGIRFLHGFVKDLAKSIQLDGREHIEYVPTQIVTEYFRRVFRPSLDRKIHGIHYKSSRKTNGICCVLFFLDKHCCDSGTGWQSNEEKWLGLIKSTRHEVQVIKRIDDDS